MIEQWFHQTLLYVSSHPHLGIMFAFIISLSESLPLIGTVIPGSVTMTAIGTLIGADALPMFSTLLWASVGAFIGDCIGYYLGKYYDTTIRQVWPFKRYPHWITKGEDFFHLHGGKSIIIGRFVGPVRSTIPLIAGLLKLKTARFMLAAAPSAISWALAYTVPGIILGALSLDLSPQIATKFVLIGLVVIVFGWAIFWACYKLGHYITRRIDRLFHHLWQSIAQKNSALYRVLKRKYYPNDHHQLTLFTFALITALLFAFVFFEVVTHGWLTSLNKPIFYMLQSYRGIYVDRFFAIFTLLGDKPVILGFAALMIAWLWWQKHLRAASYLFATSFLAAAAIGFFKLIYHSARPDSIQFVATSSSFPSGHTLLCVVILGFCAYLATVLTPRAWRKMIYFDYIVLVLLVALSRLYLGAHWFTDILGSVTLGLTILFVMTILYRRQLHGARPIQPWITAIVLALCIPWITYGSWQFSRTVEQYTPKYPTVTSNLTQWWHTPNADLPLYRSNRFGHPVLPFNVQWAAQFPEVRHSLLSTGWHIIDNPTSLSYNINRLKSYKPSQHLPFVPILFHGLPPRATFYKPAHHNNEILELTLWLAPVKFLDQDLPIWIGTLDYHRTVRLKLIQLSKQLHFMPPNDEIPQLTSSLDQYQYKIINIAQDQMPPRIQKLDWNGKVIIIKPK